MTDISNGYSTIVGNKPTPTEKLNLSTINAALQGIAELHPEYFNNGYGGIFHAPDSQTYLMLSDIGTGKIFINFAINENGFDAGTFLVNAFEKLKKGLELPKDEEYAIEMLWHEILHLKSKNTKMLPGVDEKDVGFQRVAVETFNQLFARKTYPEFLAQLGGKAQHAEWILENGYAYKIPVTNIRKLLSTMGSKNDIFLKKLHRKDFEESFLKKAEKLLMKDYTNFDTEMIDLLKRYCKPKYEWDIINAFKHIEFRSIDTFFLKNPE